MTETSIDAIRAARAAQAQQVGAARRALRELDVQIARAEAAREDARVVAVGRVLAAQVAASCPVALAAHDAMPDDIRAPTASVAVHERAAKMEARLVVRRVKMADARSRVRQTERDLARVTADAHELVERSIGTELIDRVLGGDAAAGAAYRALRPELAGDGESYEDWDAAASAAVERPAAESGPEPRQGMLARFRT